jgi:molybdate transport system regulatory protein
MTSAQLNIRIRLKHGQQVVLGPGKAQLLAGITETGSIAAAGRKMEMSYKRAWMMIEGMNAAFGGPLVEKNRGGSTGGGATLTPLGSEVLSLYIQLIDAAEKATLDQCSALEALLAKASSE